MEMSFRGASLIQADRLQISLSGEAAAQVREALESGEYQSADEVVADALRQWRHEPAAEDVAHLRAAWEEAVEAGGPGLDPEPINARLREKFGVPQPATSG